jgi:hypothetical protein
VIKKAGVELLSALLYAITLAPLILLFVWLEKFGTVWYHTLGGCFILWAGFTTWRLRELKESLGQMEQDYSKLEDELYKWRQKWD